MKNLIIDCFAGGGGASVGIEMALGRQVDIAINHSPEAISMHSQNHPDTLHLTEDIFEVNLKKYVGNQHVALMWASPDCFPAGNLVWTKQGYKNIEDVQCNDLVLTHKGNYKKVYRTIKKNTYKFCNIKIAGCEEFQTTLNHPFYARKKKAYSVHGEHRTTITKMLEPEWVKAENLTSEYRVGIPINTESIIPKWNGTVMYLHNQYGLTKSEIQNTLDKYMDNGDFWWLIGRYIGDGSVSETKYMVDICCSFDETEEIRSILSNLDLKYTTRKKKTTYSFIFSSKELCEFVSQFGIGSLNKQITPTILNLPTNLLQRFMDGYISADGCKTVMKTNTRYHLCTVSKKLAYGLQQCLLKAYGRYAGMTKSKNRNHIQGRIVNTHDFYTLVFYEKETNRLQYKIENNIAWVNVKKNEIVNDSQKSIYTLSVEDDESFTINNVSVHNCTSHSKAKGGKPRKQGLRILPWAVYKHAKQILPDVIIMENVEEIQQWGPLDEEGHPIQEKKGEDYKKFINAMMSLGYEFDSRELVAADYGAPTIRKRWYAIFRRDGKEIVWPEPTHSKNGNNGLKPWVSVYTVLDCSNIGNSIYGRKKALADKTQKRIARGLEKFILKNDNPFKFYIKEEQRNKWVSQFIMEYYGQGTGQTMYEPLHTIVTKDRFALITVFGSGNKIDDICLRMLTAEELKLAQGFPKDYIIEFDCNGKAYPKKEQVARIGNSVVPTVAEQLVKANCSNLKIGERKPNISIDSFVIKNGQYSFV